MMIIVKIAYHWFAKVTLHCISLRSSDLLEEKDLLNTGFVDIFILLQYS